MKDFEKPSLLKVVNVSYSTDTKMLDMLDSTIDEAVPIPRELFEHCDEIRKLAEENKQRESLLDRDDVCTYYLDKMQASINSGTIRLPSGLTREERRAWLKNIPVRDKDNIALARPVDITLEEAFNIAFERYEDTLEELAKK